MLLSSLVWQDKWLSEAGLLGFAYDEIDHFKFF